MKKFKKILAVLLCVLIFSGMIPTEILPKISLPQLSLPNFSLSTNAASNTLVYGNENGITRAEWLYDLTLVFNIEVDDLELPDNYFSDLTSTHKYYKSILKAVQFGIVDIPAGEELKPDDYVTRDFAASTLNFCLGYQLEEGAEYTYTDSENVTSPESAQIALNREWFELIDGAFSPETLVSSDEVKTMLDDAKEVLAGQVIDENYESTYEFAEDVIVLPDTLNFTEDENGVITITDCPETIKENDKFAVYFNNIPVVYTALNVSTENNITTISTKQTKDEEAFADVDAQGVIDSSAMEIIPADGVEVSFDDSTSGASTYAIKKTKNLNCTLPLSFGGFSGKVSVSIENPYVDYSISSDKAYVTLNGETTVTYGIYGNLAETAGLSKGFTLFTCNIGGVGSFDVVVNVNFSGSATGTVKGFLTAGVECEKGVGIRTIRNFLQHECYTTVNAETSVSLRASLGATKMPVISAYVYAEVGIRANYSKKTFAGDVTPKECVHFASYLFASYGASASVKFGPISYSESITNEIYSESNSPVRTVFHYEDGMPVAKCSKGTNYSNFFTIASSRRSGCGWMGANGAYGLNADGTTFALYNYTVSDGNATITKYNGNSAYVSIPETIDGYTVTAIGNNAFKNKNVSYVKVPDCVIGIGTGAFYGCVNLKTIDLSKNLEIISPQSFYNCISLSSIELPNKLTTIYYDAFYNCDALKKINIPKSLQNVYTNTSLSSSQYQKDGPFDNCSGLKTVIFENGITTIPARLFAYCNGLETVVIPDTVTTVGPMSFYKCSNLQKVKLSNNLTTINYEAFYDCTNLFSIELPKTLTAIYYDAFYNCDALNEINIPKSLVNVYTNTGLASSQYKKDGPFDNCSSLRTVIFEEGITKIPARLFAYCDGLENVTIPNTVTTIETLAFFKCSALNKISLSENLTIVNNEAFCDCVLLKDIVLPDSLGTIGSGIFKNCTSIENINITHEFASALVGYTDDFEGPFYKCSNLKNVTFAEGIEDISIQLFEQCTGIEKIKIPETVKTIYGSSFKGCTSLTEINIPKSVTKIYANAFQNCKSLKKVEISGDLSVLGTNCFYGCTSLESIKLPNNLIEIPDYTFYNCSSLKTIELPESVKTINQYAFYNCPKLEKVDFSKNLKMSDIYNYAFYNCDALKEIVLPENVKTVAGSAFYDCDTLEKVYIPQSTKTLGASAFLGCDMLSDITFADYSITAINANTFKDCPTIEKVVLPKGLKTIGSRAFMNCTGLTEVTIPQSVTSIDSTAFSYPAKTTIYGVAGSYAETFANNGGFKFIDISAPSEGLALSDFAEYIVLDRGETYRAEFITFPEETTDIITLTASNSNVTINGLDIYASRTGDTLITATASSGITYEFTVHIRDVKNITITTAPTKTEYITGEKLDTNGMVITVNYNDGTSKTVTDYTVSGFDSSVEGNSTITVKWVSAYGSTYSATFSTTIINPIPELTGIYIKEMPFRTIYNRGVQLDLNGLVIMGTYTDGSEQQITDYTSTKINILKLGEQTVTITSGEFTCTFNVTVVNCTSHTEGDWEITIKPTEQTEGEHCKRCTICQTVLATETMGKLSAGDLNGDGEVNIIDLVRLKKILAGTAESTGTSADIDNSGSTDSVDLSILRKIMLGIDVPLGTSEEYTTKSLYLLSQPAYSEQKMQ